MQILEQKLKGKRGDPSLCEDAIVVTPHFLAVIDGVTSKSPVSVGGRSTGRAAADALAAGIRALPPGIDAPDAVERLSAGIYTLYEQNGLLEQARSMPEYRLCACAAIYSTKRQEVWMIGDCQCMLDGALYSFPKRVDLVTSEARSLYAHSLLRAGKSVDELLETDMARAYILPLIRMGMRFANTSGSPYSYVNFDGFSVPREGIRQIDACACQEIVLATDGYPRLFGTLEESERYLSGLRERDPLCISEYLSTKGFEAALCSFDDRAYLRFQP